jgi:predicted ATPase
MRIAFSGTHRSGKSTLLDEVAGLLPHYDTVEEPYYLLEEDGYETAEMPSLEDFEAQLERSILSLQEAGTNVLFDRGPADVLAYLLAHDDAAGFDADGWLERVVKAMRTLDLVIYVPVESPDRIAVPAHDHRDLRMAVHDTLEDLLLEDRYGFEVAVLRVHGDLQNRTQQVWRRIKATF